MPPSSRHRRPLPTTWRVLALGMAGVALLGLNLSGCSSRPPTDHRMQAVSPDPVFEQQEVARARQHELQGHLAEAATSWEVLAVLRPDVPAYAAQLAETRARIAQQVKELLPAARQAQQRSAWDEAASRYLALLALQPDDTATADALRAIERERNKRDHLGRYARVTLASRAQTGTGRQDGEAANALSTTRNDLEHAALLAGQGAYDDAIGLLSRRLKAQPRDTATRQLLADVYFQKARDRQQDKAARLQALNQCLQLQPGHAAARALRAELGAPPARAPASVPPASSRP